MGIPIDQKWDDYKTGTNVSASGTSQASRPATVNIAGDGLAEKLVPPVLAGGPAG